MDSASTHRFLLLALLAACAFAAPASAATHPDPPPEGIDIEDPRSVAELESDEEGDEPGEGDPGSPAPAAAPCIGTGHDGNRVLAVYARASNRLDRFAALVPLIREWAAEASGVFNASAGLAGTTRRVRFVTSAPPVCEVTVANVVLPASGDDNFSNTVSALRDLGFDDPDRKYLVWMDANVICGQAQIRDDDSDSPANRNNGYPGVPGMIARVDNGCWGRLGDRESIEAHELVHTLGGIQQSAPNSSGGWHCVDEADTMCYSDSPLFPTMLSQCPPVYEVLLDCRGDDYFNAAQAPRGYIGSHWNVADSSFLAEGGPPAPLPTEEPKPPPPPAGEAAPLTASAGGKPAKRCKPGKKMKRGRCVRKRSRA
jgi:hypothetical protein